MKKNTLRKLTLSAVTMGVAALSLTSTTYAWFTTNGSATASGISGTVAAADSNMLIKTAKYTASTTTANATDATWPTNFSKDLTKIESVKATQSSDSDATNNAIVTPALQPVTWKDTAFVKAGSTTGNFEEKITDNVDVLHYEVVFAITNLSTTATQTVSVKFNGFNDVKASQYLLVDAGNAIAGSSVEVNLLDVLSLRTQSEVIGTDEIGTYNITTSSTDNMVTKISDNAGKNYRYKKDVNTNEDAIEYYNNVYGLTEKSKIAKPDDSTQGYSSTTLMGDADANSINLFSVQGESSKTTVYVKTDFYFYIDGWDYQCFNCVGGLELSGGNMTFELK